MVHIQKVLGMCVYLQIFVAVIKAENFHEFN